MAKDISEITLIKYVYGEVTPAERTFIAETLKKDVTLRAKYKELKALMHALDNADVPAPEDKLKRVFDYLKSKVNVF